MIRVVMRHIDDASSALLGDFPPGEIGALLEVLEGTVLYHESDTPMRVSVDTPTQMVRSGGSVGSRYVLEILTEDID